MAEFTDGTHPDLTPEGELRDETPSAPTQPAPDQEAEPVAQAADRAQSEAPQSSPDGEVPAGASETAPAETPPWLAEALGSKDPKAILAALTKNMSREEVARDPVLQGLLGDLAQKRAKSLLERQQLDQIEYEKRRAVATGDTYRLGQLTEQEVRARAQQEQQAQTTAPFMDGVVAFQNALPLEVQAQVQGRQWGEGKSYAEGVKEYLEAVADAAVSHRLNQAVDNEIKRREPALKKALLSETNGQEPSPERTNGHAVGVREITDEQIDRMSLEEFDTYFDERGQPRNGVRVRMTRGIPIQKQ